MNFYFLSFFLDIILIFFIFLGDYFNFFLIKKKIGLFDIFHIFYITAEDIMKEDFLSLISLSFFLNSFLKSNSLQSFLFYKKEKIKKNRYFFLFIITLFVSFLSSNFSWFDEFIYLYSLLSPFFLLMGFNKFSSFLCIYGGSISGLLGLTSSWRIEKYFNKCGIVYNNKKVDSFLFFFYLLLTSFFVTFIFNIFYSKKNQKNAKKGFYKKNEKLFFDVEKKIVFFLFIITFFLSIFSRIFIFNIFSSKIFPEFLNTKWESFGNWGLMSIDCLFIVSGIFISLISKKKIMENLIESIIMSIPSLLIIIFSSVPSTIIKITELKIKNDLKNYNDFILLNLIFFFSILISFFFNSTSLIESIFLLVKNNLNKRILFHGVIFSWIGGIIGTCFSPYNGTLINSLLEIKSTYNYFIKKTYILWIILFFLSWFFIFLEIKKSI